MNKTFWAIVAVIVIVFGGIIYFNKRDTKAPSTGNAQPTNHVMGSTSSGVKLVEYADYECPYCGEFYPIVKQVVSKYQNQIQYQFRNLPLVQIHQNALAAARAAEAADKQGKYWQMHDLLFTNQNTWAQSNNPTTYFDQYAQQLGMNVSQFNTDSDSAAVNDAINADIAAFQKTGQEMATPTFFLDGKKIQPTSVADFDKLISAEIAAKAKQK